MLLGPRMYEAVTDRTLARGLFAQNVVRVEVETHSYCNRRCTYCPNVVGDRLGPNVRMAPDLWEKLICGLEEIAYGGWMVFNYYNEPLADLSILERLREARRRLPGARLMIYTNGDYLEPGLVDRLAEAGLDYLHVSIHLKRGDSYTDLYVLNRIIEVSVRMGLPARLEQLRPGELAIAKVPHRSMEIEIRGINFDKHGTDRGGLIGEIATASRRADPCTFPFLHFVVAYDGRIVPCCHIRADRPEHAAYVYGNLRDFGSIFEAYTSEAAAAWRRELVGGQEKRPPCDTCSAGKLKDPKALARMVAAHGKYVAPRLAAEAG